MFLFILKNVKYLKNLSIFPRYVITTTYFNSGRAKIKLNILKFIIPWKF